MARRSLTFAVLLAAGLLTAACGSDSAADGLSVTGAWARTSPSMVDTGAAYMELESSSGDRLISASVEPAIAAAVEIHEVVPVDGQPDVSDEAGMSDDGDMASGDGTTDMAMTMRELAGGLELPPGEAVTLAPGGYHLMLLDLAAPLELDSSFDLTLDFENAGSRTITVEVRDEAP